jgi:hypothetical protein
MGAIEHDFSDPRFEEPVNQFAFMLAGRERHPEFIECIVVDRDHHDILRHHPRPDLRACQPEGVFGRQRKFDRGRDQAEQDRENRHLHALALEQRLA